MTQRGSRNLYLVLIVAFHLLLLANIQFTPWPELHLWPYLMDNGYKIYQDFAFEKPPLLPVILWFWTKLAGINLISLKLLTWTTIVSVDIFVYKVARKVYPQGNFRPLIALAIYVLLMTSFDGNALWFDLLITLFFLLILISIQTKKIVLAGFFLSLALLTKQNSIIILPALIIAGQAVNLSKQKHFLLNVAKGAFPALGISAAMLFLTGVLDDAIIWIFKFPPTLVTYSFQSPTLKFAGILTVITYLLLFLSPTRTIAIWGLTGLAFIYPRFELFHIQPALPFVALALARYEKFRTSPLLLVCTIIIIAYSSIHILHNWRKPDRFYEDSTIATVEWLKSNTDRGEKIYLLNTWDHIYVLSNTIPSIKPWFHYLPWYLNYNGVQQSIISNLKNNPPRLILSENISAPPETDIEKFVMANFLPTSVLNERFTLWQPK